jgi:hypothetical protein
MEASECEIDFGGFSATIIDVLEDNDENEVDGQVDFEHHNLYRSWPRLYPTWFAGLDWQQ